MRLSIHERDAGEYIKDLRRMNLTFRCEIYLNGVKQTKVLVADEEREYIVRHTDEQRFPFPTTELLNGEVVIIDPDSLFGRIRRWFITRNSSHERKAR